jgi:hypothetical protein
MRQDFSNYKTPQEKLEELLQKIEVDLNSNNQDVACEQLSKIGQQQQNLLHSVSSLYQIYLNLISRC